MHTNNTTLSKYFELLTSHIKNVDNFNVESSKVLTNANNIDLLFENIAKRVVVKILDYRVSYSTSQKIIVVLKELTEQSKHYLDRAIGISGVLYSLIDLVNHETV